MIQSAVTRSRVIGKETDVVCHTCSTCCRDTDPEVSTPVDPPGDESVGEEELVHSFIKKSSRPAEAQLYQTPSRFLTVSLLPCLGMLNISLWKPSCLVDSHGCLLGGLRMSPQLWCTFIFFLCFCSMETGVAKLRPTRHVFPSHLWIFEYVVEIAILFISFFLTCFPQMAFTSGGKRRQYLPSPQKTFRGDL